MTTTVSALDGALFHLAQILTYLVNNEILEIVFMVIEVLVGLWLIHIWSV